MWQHNTVQSAAVTETGGWNGVNKRGDDDLPYIRQSKTVGSEPGDVVGKDDRSQIVKSEKAIVPKHQRVRAVLELHITAADGIIEKNRTVIECFDFPQTAGEDD